MMADAILAFLLHQIPSDYTNDDLKYKVLEDVLLVLHKLLQCKSSFQVTYTLADAETRLIACDEKLLNLTSQQVVHLVNQLMDIWEHSMDQNDQSFMQCGTTSVSIFMVLLDLSLISNEIWDYLPTSQRFKLALQHAALDDRRALVRQGITKHIQKIPKLISKYVCHHVLITL